MTRDIDAAFDDLFGDTYPGSRHKRRETTETYNSGTEQAWDADPKMLLVNGVEVEFFTVGALAMALNREVVTVRSWERKGYLPKAPFRSAGKRQNRLYTRAHIEGIRRIAMHAGLLDPSIKKSPKDTNFVEQVRDLFATIKAAS